MVYIQQSEKVPKFSGNLDRADSPTLEKWIELTDNHIQLKPTENEKANCVYNVLMSVMDQIVELDEQAKPKSQRPA